MLTVADSPVLIPGTQDRHRAPAARRTSRRRPAHAGRALPALFALPVLLLALALPFVAAPPALAGLIGGDFEIYWDTTDLGGGESSGGDFSLVGTIGQTDAGPIQFDSTWDTSLAGGFWTDEFYGIVLRVFKNDPDVQLKWTVFDGMALFDVYYSDTSPERPGLVLLDSVIGGSYFHLDALDDGYDYYYDVRPQ